MKKTIFSLIFTVFAAAVLHAQHWPGWRGPRGTGVSSETTFPVSWDASNIRWKTPIPGRGHSSPIVWGDRIFLTTSIEGDVVPGREKKPKHMLGSQVFIHPDMVSHDRRQTMKVIGLDAKSGRILWERTAYDGPMADGRHRKSSFASSTPVTDGKTVFVFFGTEGLYAYDFDGALKWKQDLGEIRTLGLGYATSPVLFGTVVIVQCDEDNGEKSFIAAFDEATGKQVWRQTRKVQSSWATPVLVDAGGRTELVAGGAEFTIAYNPATGKELWRTKGVESNAIPSPVYGNGIVYMTAGYPTKAVLAVGRNVSSGNEPKILWAHARGTAYVPSPILVGDSLYLTTDRGLLTNLDAKTGEMRYEGGRVPVPATFTASLVGFGDKILQASEDGDVFVIQAGPEHKVIATNKLGEPIFASPALSNGVIYIRGERHLYAIRK
ncbi:MAG: PQQ-binding-like beta-propeller repeat protein [Vicinamibacterales bacterium]